MEASSQQALAARLRLLADTEMRGYSPLYERISRALADDGALLDRLAPLGHPNRLPILVLAAVHDLALADPDGELAATYRGERPGADPWPPFRAVLDGRFEEVAATVARRSIQTNEVGRATAVLPALAVAAADLGAGPDRPLAVVEVGASAGLNLRLDRYRHRYDDEAGSVVATWGPPGAAVELACTLVGAGRPPLPDGPLPLGPRQGIDLAPVDLGDPEARRWLEACLWPDVPFRPARLRAAVADALGDPDRPPVHAGDAVTDLGPALAALPPGVVPCVVATWALAYLTPDGRSALHEVVAAEGARRDVALVTAEYRHVTPWVPEPPRPPSVEEGTGATLLGLATWRGGRAGARPLAWMQAHGRWLDWLA